MFDPNAKPKTTAYTIDRALIVKAVLAVAGMSSAPGTSVAAGSKKANDVTPQTARAPIIQFNRLSLSARRLGTHLPTQLPALKTAISWYENACVIALLE